MDQGRAVRFLETVSSGDIAMCAAMPRIIRSIVRPVAKASLVLSKQSHTNKKVTLPQKTTLELRTWYLFK